MIINRSFSIENGEIGEITHLDPYSLFGRVSLCGSTRRTEGCTTKSTLEITIEVNNRVFKYSK